MVRTTSLLTLLAAALRAASPSNASPLSRPQQRDELPVPANLVGLPDLWAQEQARLPKWADEQVKTLAASAERRSPAGPADSKQKDTAKVRGLVPEDFCRSWLQGAVPPRATITVNEPPAPVTVVATSTELLPTTRTLVDTTVTSFATSVQTIDEATTLSETEVVETLEVIPETSTTSETLTLSFTQTSTPLSTLTVPTTTSTFTSFTSTSTTSTTAFQFTTVGRVAAVPRAPRRPAKPKDVVSYSDETVTDACLLKLYGVLIYPDATVTAVTGVAGE